MVKGKGWKLKCESTIDIHDDGYGFDLLYLSFKVNKPVDVAVTLEYKNKTTQTTKVSQCRVY